MFQFHGWLCIQIDDSDDADIQVLDARMAIAVNKLKSKIVEIDDGFCHFHIGQAGNDLNYAALHGLRNHRFEPIIDLFRWAAKNLPESYGLLYVWDDEDHAREKNFENCYRVWRLAQGQLEERADPFLSPCIPTIEKPFSQLGV